MDDDATVPLPCDNPRRWQEFCRLFLLLAQCKKLKELEQLAVMVKSGASFSSPSDKEQLQSMLGNLHKCLREYFTEKDREIFLCKTLPLIAQLATELPKHVPPDGVPFLKQQTARSLSLSRQLIASLLANGFLCSFSVSVEQNSSTIEGLGLNFDHFFSVFSWEDKGNHHASQLAKLKSILCYFNQIANSQCDLKGLVTISRNIVPDDKLPTMNDWKASNHNLCTVVLKSSSTADSDQAHALQAIMASRSVGFNMLQSGRMEEEIKFCQFPELLVLLLVCDEMESNEALLVKGVAQFCHCRGCGASLEFVEEHVDRSKRDSFGTYQNLLVAIDAVPFRSKKADNQYRQSYILRELNKALVGFYCVEMRGDSMVDSVSDVHEALKSSGSSSDFMRHFSVHPEWKIGCDDTDDDETDKADDISDFASAVVSDVFASITNDGLNQFASAFVTDIVTQAVQATSSGDEISQFASDVVDTIIDSVLNGNLIPSKGLTVGELLDTQAKAENSQYQTYAEELTTIIISNALQSISQDGNADKPPVKPVPTSFNEQLSMCLQGLASGRHSPVKGNLKPSAIRTPSGWNECLMGLHLSANSRKTNSMIWSSAATVNEGSDPPSPSELASMCLDDVTDGVSEFAADLSSVIVAEVVSSIADHDTQFSVDASTSIQSLKNADFPDGSLSVLDSFSPKWNNKSFNLLRPVTTTNWGGGPHNGDIQLKSLLQWMAVSATGRPYMTYYTEGEQSMEKFEAVYTHVTQTTPHIGKLAEQVLEYCTLKSQQKQTEDLFTFLLSQTV